MACGQPLIWRRLRLPLQCELSRPRELKRQMPSERGRLDPGQALELAHGFLHESGPVCRILVRCASERNGSCHEVMRVKAWRYAQLVYETSYEKPRTHQENKGERDL